MLDLSEIELKKFGGNYRENGVCAMQAVAWMAGDSHTAYPYCVDSSLSCIVISLNDSGTPEDRERLKPYLPHLIGTRGKTEAYHIAEGLFSGGDFFVRERFRLKYALSNTLSRQGIEKGFAFLEEWFGDQVRAAQERESELVRENELVPA